MLDVMLNSRAWRSERLHATSLWRVIRIAGAVAVSGAP